MAEKVQDMSIDDFMGAVCMVLFAALGVACMVIF